MESKKIVLLYSGGLDSYIAYNYAKFIGYEVIPIYINLNHDYAEKEKNSIKLLGIECINLDINIVPILKHRLSNQIIPSRNMLFATIGSMFSENVWICALDGEQNGKERDKSEYFFKESSNLLTYLNNFFQPVTNISSPFNNLSKQEIINLAISINIPIEKLFLTTSCYSKSEIKCGKCLTCYKRYTAFLLNNILEPNYESNPLDSDYFKELCSQIPIAFKNQDYSRFSFKRISEHIKLLEIIKKL